jgi:PST family polysaccharide transporter
MQFRNLAIRSIISKLVAAILAVFLALIGWGVWSLVAQLLTMSVIATIILWVTTDWRPKIMFSKQHFKGLFSFGIQITGSRILGFMNAQLHDFVIGYYLDAASLGFFSVAHTFTKRLVTVLRNVILDVAYPAFSQHQDQPDELRSMFNTASKYTSLILFPIYTLIFLLAPEIVLFLFGPDWTPAVQITRILALMGGVYGLISYFSQMLMAIGQTKVLLGIRFLTLCINTIGFFLSLRFGLLAITVSYVASWYIITPVYYYYVNKHIHLQHYLGNFKESTTGVLCMSVVVVISKMLLGNLLGRFPLMLISGISGMASYGFVLYIFAPVTAKRLINYLISVLPKQHILDKKKEKN